MQRLKKPLDIRINGLTGRLLIKFIQFMLLEKMKKALFSGYKGFQILAYLVIMGDSYFY